MSIALVVTGGYGNGTLVGSIAKVVTAGYTIGAAAISQPALRQTLSIAATMNNTRNL